MNKRVKLTSIAAVGLAIIGTTAAVYFFTVKPPRVALDWWAFFFVLFSELLLLGVVIHLATATSESDVRIVRTGILSLCSIYWIIAVIFAVLRHIFTDYLNVFIAVNIVLIGIVIAISVVLNMFALRLRSADSGASSQLFLRDVERRLYSYQSNSAYSEFGHGLSALYEAVKFSDKTASSSVDESIDNEMDRLEAALNDKTDVGKTAVETAISNISAFLAQRSAEMSQQKRGGF